jgi:ketosteroid isomerase-like protein
MSEENVDTLRRAFEAAERERDPKAILDALDPEVVWEVRADLPDAETYRGHEGVRRLIASFDEVLTDSWYRPIEFLDVGDHVVVPLRWGGRGRTSGAESDLEEVWVFTLRAGRVIRVREFAAREAALEAAGLSE